MSRLLLRRQVLSWALYDWANSAFATTVLAGFFPIFFKQYWSAGADVTVSTLRLGLANSGAALLVAILAPLLGAIADRGGTRKKGLILFAMLGVVMTSMLFFIGAGNWVGATLVFAGGSIGFALANVFNDSMIVDVSADHEMDVVSGLGYALGYLGGGLLFVFGSAFFFITRELPYFREALVIEKKPFLGYTIESIRHILRNRNFFYFLAHYFSSFNAGMSAQTADCSFWISIRAFFPSGVRL